MPHLQDRSVFAARIGKLVLGLSIKYITDLLHSLQKRQSHVNLCIDGPSESKTAGGFFAPLSVLFRPRGTESISSKPTSTKVTSSTAKTKAPVDKKPSVAPVKVEKPVVPAAKKESKPGSLLSAIMPNAFTALMSGHTETKQWKAAQEADQRRGRVPKGEIRSVPFYKWIDGMEITVRPCTALF